MLMSWLKRLQPGNPVRRVYQFRGLEFRGGLNPAEAPLISAEILFRQPGPAQDIDGLQISISIPTRICWLVLMVLGKGEVEVGS